MRRRWRRAAEPPAAGHVDDWLMTYADMITLLLCFLVVLLTLSTPKQEAAAVMAPIEPAAPPARLALQTMSPVASASEEAAPQPPARHLDPPAPQEPALASPNLPPVEVIPPPALDTPMTQGMDIEPNGDRITTLEISSAAFFDSGSATLSRAGEAILAEVAVKLNAETLRDYRITVEGHTDDAPIATARFPSNWELSTARAAAVVHYFLDHGIPAQRLRAAGYADTFPKAPNRDARGNPIPENQTQNRRVVIKLEKIEKARRGATVATAG